MTVLLIASAVVPALLLLVYFYKKDRYEKEPKKLLFALFGLGALSIIPAVVLELILGGALNSAFAGEVTVTEEGYAFYSYPTLYLYIFLENFVCVALVEESCKWVATLGKTKNCRYFNSYFDGIVYSVYVSLGFAALENVFYVIDGGFTLAFQRAFTSIPGHMCFGVLMGYYYTEWHLRKKAFDIEEGLIGNGLVSPGVKRIEYKKHYVFSLLIPTLAHGFYDFALSSGEVIFVMAFFAFIVFLFTYCFRKVSQASKKDTSDGLAVLALINEKYPFLRVTDGGKFVSPDTQASYARPAYQPPPVSLSQRPWEKEAAKKPEFSGEPAFFFGVFTDRTGTVESAEIVYGDRVTAGYTVLFKVRESGTGNGFAVVSTRSGTVTRVLKKAGDRVGPGQPLAIVKADEER